MLTLFVWCIMNGILFHYDAHTLTEELKIVINVICVASDLNLIATLSRK